ncbi:CCA tRNA nucleotidyltransferase [Primorskyibacter sp. S187A]|uniref:CCA tRNA nucleotidyltransferase n=1 Tax=Primorskyibacter sp. S187A TaxID=3415130 RepID=UPI003C7A6BE9
MIHVCGSWLSDAATQSVFDALTAQGHEVFVVGGCVRNALLGVPVSDVDMATNADPETVIALAKAAKLRAIPTGIEHGTITILSNGTPFEVTSYRRDVATDGRRATIAFAQSAEEDAHRRDFTMNALYADRHGQVRDFVGGLADVQARRLRFIDDPTDRIKEDYLRILRFFRFSAWYTDPQGGMDQEALAAIADNLDGLSALSKERVTHEFLKLLTAPNPSLAVATMQHVGVLQALLPGASAQSLPVLIDAQNQIGVQIDVIARLVSLGAAEPEAQLRLSKAQSKALALYDAQRGGSERPAVLGYRYGVEPSLQILCLRSAALETPLPALARQDVERGAEAVFPIKAADLMQDYSGPALGEALRRLERQWIASDFKMTREDLLRAE